MPDGLAIGSNGKIYVTNIQSDSVTVYGDFTTWAADGNTAPIKTLSGADTGLDGPWGIAFDALGNMYVANAESVTMYAGEIPPPTTAPTTTIPPAPEVSMLPATM
jgi:DNA-binding beta-propeller fold protein YncE